jgi:predicted dehydrogenase
MTHKRIRWGLVGGGPDSLIGIVHRIAALMGEDCQLVGGVFNAQHALGEEFAAHLELDTSRAYPDLDALIRSEIKRPLGERMSLVTVATPNYLHYEMALKLVRAGFHVVCEKPVTTTAAQAAELATLVRQSGTVFAVAHTYTGYPMVRQMRSMIARDAIGAVQKVQAQYLQGWINPVIHNPGQWASVWRLNPALGGQSCCIGDIGVHAFNLIEYTTGLTVAQVLADIDTLNPANPLDVDGSALLRFTNGVKGVLVSSQIATAEENNLQISVYGRSGALKWAQEQPNRLEYLREGEPAAIMTPGHPYNGPEARAATKLPPGHPEGFIDAMGNIYRGVIRAVRGEAAEAGDFPGIEAGVRGMRFVEAVLQSARGGNQWTNI